LTGRDSLEDEIRSLNLGADEYLTKPCNPGRLLLRAKKLMNLYEKFKDSLVLGDISFDPTSYKLSYKKDYIIFPLTEGEILKNLLEAYPDLVKKDQLLEEVWSSKYIDENILQVNITRLRKKLAAIGLKGLIKNVRGSRVTKYYMRKKTMNKAGYMKRIKKIFANFFDNRLYFCLSFVYCGGR
jgi:DNA-binding response OmpR family regulator